MATNKLMSITEAFRKIVEDNQSKVALCENERQITYKELDILSDNLAKKIVDLGIQQETMIGIPSQRSIELVIGMLAILKSGCCYVPIDEKYPLKRLEYMIADTNMKFFLSNGPQGKFSELGVQPILFELNELSKEGHTSVNRSSENGLAYVIYTSGTTGKPKGVMIEQSSVVNLVLNSKILEINENNRVAQFSNPCFDAATFEIWGALLNGATLFLMSNEFTSFDDWKEAISVGKVDVAFFTTGLFNAMVDEDPFIFEGLKKIVVGGDKISISHVNRLKQTIGHVSLINGYGPTECTTFAICHEVEDKDVDAIPIGKPLSNVEIKILSEEQVEVGDGEIGEIYIGGQGVMRGYLNQPELTEQALIIDDLNQTKWYKTGDHGIRLNNGEILYKGRKDSQVKIRGFRIELNEIQEKLDKYTKVESSVVAVKNINNENYVTAYYTHKDENTENVENDIKDYLSNELPNYMIPHFFVRIDNFPLNANGKVDKEKLLEMDIMQSKTSVAIQEDGKKKEVLEIWKKVLGNQSLGLDDNFFENGGHSILATKLVYVMKETVLPEATLQILLANNTVNKFVDALEMDSSGSIEVVMENDSTLDHSLKEKIREICAQPVQFEKNMLITGGTGFLGAHLLNKLLVEIDHVKIYCLVRFPSKNRLKDTLIKYGLWQDEFESRIVVIEGDFSKHQFGLDDMTYEKLSNDVSQVYHVGAETNFFEPYSKSKISNVDGVVEIVKFASSNTRKNIYYASTLSVLTGERKWDEEDELVYSSDLMIGYSQSKWVAEKLLLQARDYGLTVDIFRLGRISSNSSNGVWNEKDMLYKVFESFIDQKILPFKEEIHFELMPVDFVSEFIYKISRLDENNKLGIYHMFNDQKVSSEFVTSFFEKNDIPYSNMDLDEWLQSLKEKTQSNEIHSLSALSQLIDESTKLKESEILQSKTKKELDLLSMRMPEIDSRYVENFMKFMLN
ncbi:non-ribosomal peptide synthetase [Peribacillus butanolivorans]|uniref:non-ribosomal peptide synthetase n=1 Tax=Peribacillus butanolivorans TaxID=421767 RepID=UPI0036BD6598